MSDSQSWLPIRDLLAKWYKVITFDNRGVGRTIPQEVECSIKLIAEDVVALMDYLDIEQAAVLGHSLGGFVAMELALLAGARVEAMVLEACAVRVGAENIRLFESWVEQYSEECDLHAFFAEVFEWIFSEKITGSQELMNMYLDCSVNYPYPQSAEGLALQVEALKRMDFGSRLGNINVPTLLVGAELDRLFAISECIEGLSKIPGSTSRIIKGVGHALHVEKPGEFVDIVVDFLG